MKEIHITHYSDGWSIEVDHRGFYWNHNDEDLGTIEIKNLLEHLGHTVTLEECY
jgi:hypothetical protein